MPSLSLSQRMRKLQAKLLAIRLGSGAVVLPKDIKRIHLRFAPNTSGGHMGPKKFWRHELVRLKYHNPAIPMTLDRTALQTEPATLSVHYASNSSSPAPSSSTTQSTPSASAPSTDRVETITMTHSTNSEILDALVRLTKATVLEPTAEEREDLESLEQARARSARDAKVSEAVRARLRRERELLEQARGQMAG